MITKQSKQIARKRFGHVLAVQLKMKNIQNFTKAILAPLMIHICIYTIKLKVRSILLTYFLFQKQRHLTFMSLSERRALVYT